jgi:hypothetical protein
MGEEGGVGGGGGDGAVMVAKRFKVRPCVGSIFAESTQPLIFLSISKGLITTATRTTRCVSSPTKANKKKESFADQRVLKSHATPWSDFVSKASLRTLSSPY